LEFIAVVAEFIAFISEELMALMIGFGKKVFSDLIYLLG
jgi:hypothetical protein